METHTPGSTPSITVDCGHVLVVGGGIGGIGAALALRRSGADVTLVERAHEFGEVGAGLQMAPNATRILERWGLLDKLLEVGVTPQFMVFRDAVTGEEILRQDLQGEFRERFGAPYIVAHRTDLHRILLEAAVEAGVTMKNDVTVTGYATVDGRGSVRTADDSVLVADAVIGADGLRSTLRSELSADEPVPSGYVAYRGALPISEVTSAADMESVVVWLGPHCHLVQYPLRKGNMFNTVAVFQSPAFLRGEEEWGSEDELEEAYSACVPQVRAALANLGRTRSWPMFDREPIESWVKDRLLLVGDAAHPMLQYLAQGACQALEDAALLEDLAAATEAFPANAAAWDSILGDFNADRAPRTARVQRVARTWGESWHVDQRIPKLLRNMLFKAAGSSDIGQYIDWLYADSEATKELSFQGVQH
jgi:2-polyprenyl-6-methoxyphenol hydroxylase-like FAD-dependent oxidoreductase